MTNIKIYKSVLILLLIPVFWGCQMPGAAVRTENRSLPASYHNSRDSANPTKINWKEYFTDPNLTNLIDTALKNNQELNIVLQEIEISGNEIRAKKGEYLPWVIIRGGAGLEKEARFTRNGAVDENIDIKPGTPFPHPFSDYMVGAYASWELDIWKKLRDAKKARAFRYLSDIEGKNFLVTNLVAEIATSYYELMALDNLLEIIRKNIEIQINALQIIRQEKEAARVTQLAVNRFEAQLLNTENLQYAILQQITEAENRINFLTGRFPSPITRDSKSFNTLGTDSVYTGIPSRLLENRPDIRQAELQLAAARLDVKVAKANFYPSFRIEAGTGFRAFNPAYLINPESILYSLAGDFMAPLINRNAIKATYNSANSRQIQAVYKYEETLLNAYIEVVNQLARINNFAGSYQAKSRESEILAQSVTISGNLFRSARADYMEVLLTQREALESKMELIEIKMNQLGAKVAMYKVLGGGWN